MPRRISHTLMVALTASVLFTLAGTQIESVGWTTSGGPAVGANALFPPPSETNLSSYMVLAQHLVSAFNLSPIDPSQTHFNSPSLYDCCLVDWGNRSVPLQNDSSVVIHTVSNQSFVLTYSSSGALARIAIHGVVGQSLANANPSTIRGRLDYLASQIGVGSVPSWYTSWTDVEPVVFNGTTRFVNAVTLARYSNYSGSPVAFGNEMQMTVDVDDRLIVGIVLYPWFAMPQPPIVTAADAYSRALGFLNQTAMGGDYRYTKGSVFFAFDPVHYVVVYQVDAIYSSGDGSSLSGIEWDVWIDTSSGNVTYAVQILPHTSVSPSNPGFPLSGFLVPLAIAAAGILLVVGFAAFSEPVWFAIFGILVPLYFRLAKNTALEHFVRGQLYAYIVSHPGISFSELREAFGLHNGSVTYHIAVLEALGFIRTASDGRRKRMYASTAHGKVLGRFLSDTQYKILEAVRQLGSAGPSEVAHALGMSKQRAAYNLKRLGELGMLVPDADVKGKFRVVPGESGDAEQVDPLPQA